MSKAPHFTREQIETDFRKFAEGKLKRSSISIEMMDAYVAICKTDDIEEWIEFCLGVNPITVRSKRTAEAQANSSDKVETRKNIQIIREHFLQKYFYDKSEKGLNEAAKRAEAEKRAEREEKERLANLSPEEKFRLKMQKYAEENR